MVSRFGSLGYTIMGKTADLTVVQKTIIDTLHKEGKPQTFITKEAGCSQSAVNILYGVQVCEFAGQSSTPTHGHLTSFWCFCQCGQVPNPAGK